MERKNYLVEKLTKEEKSYLKKIILNTRRLYIRDNYDFINSINVELCDIEDIEVESVLDYIINKYEEEFESAIEFEKIITSKSLYLGIKALSLKEKMVLFLLYKENKTINKIVLELKIDRKTARRIRNKALNKLRKSIIGGGNNV